MKRRNIELSPDIKYKPNASETLANLKTMYENISLWSIKRKVKNGTNEFLH